MSNSRQNSTGSTMGRIVDKLKRTVANEEVILSQYIHFFIYTHFYTFIYYYTLHVDK